MSQQALKTEIIRCPLCGRENFSFAAFCLACGVPIDHEAVAAATVHPADPGPPAAPLTWKPRFPLTSRLHGLEAAAGILLLLLVSGYALFTWRASADRIDAYKAGQVAEQRHDWDAAVTAFARAGDFQDASQRKSTAQQTVETRDRLYAQALDQEAQAQWAAGVSTLGQLQSIQPSYRDVPARLDTARTQLFAASLGGLVYLIDSGPGAGLFLRDAAGGRVRLPGSDGSSQVRATAPGGLALVYDRSSRAADVCPSGSGSVSAGNGGRVVVLTTLQEGSPVSEQAMPCLPGGGRGIFTSGGLWWFTGAPGPEPSYGDVYYRPADPSLPLARLAGESSGVRVAAFDPLNSRVVLVRSSPFPGADHYDSHLFVAGADGSNPIALQMLSGWLVQASVSGDGRWLLAVIQRQNPLGGRAVMLLPMPGTTARAGGALSPPLQGAVQLGPAAQTGDLFAGLVSSKDGRTAVVMSRSGMVGKAGLVVYSPDDTQPDSTPGNIGLSWDSIVPAGLSADGALVVFRGQGGAQAKLGLLSIDEAGGLGWSESQVPARPDQRVQVAFSPRQDYAVITVSSPGSQGAQAPSLFTAAVTGDGRLSPAQPLVTLHRPGQQASPPWAVSPNGYVLSYVSSTGELLATFLDKQGPVTIAKGVAGVWSLGQ